MFPGQYGRFRMFGGVQNGAGSCQQLREDLVYVRDSRTVLKLWFPLCYISVGRYK